MALSTLSVAPCRGSLTVGSFPECDRSRGLSVRCVLHRPYSWDDIRLHAINQSARYTAGQYPGRSPDGNALYEKYKRWCKNHGLDNQQYVLKYVSWRDGRALEPSLAPYLLEEGIEHWILWHHPDSTPHHSPGAPNSRPTAVPEWTATALDPDDCAFTRLLARGEHAARVEKGRQRHAQQHTILCPNTPYTARAHRRARPSRHTGTDHTSPYGHSPHTRVRYTLRRGSRKHGNMRSTKRSVGIYGHNTCLLWRGRRV